MKQPITDFSTLNPTDRAAVELQRAGIRHLSGGDYLDEVEEMLNKIDTTAAEHTEMYQAALLLLGFGE